MRKEDAEAIRNIAQRLRTALIQSGKTRAEIDSYFGTANVSQYWFSPDRNPEVPPVERWPWLREFLQIGDELDAEVWRLNGRKGKPGDAWYDREVMGQVTKGSSPLPGNHNGTWADGQIDGTFDITAPATDAAKQWLGWGSALKPAVEIIVMARKPLSEPTIAANVLRWNCGALNIDGCRIGTEPRTTHADGNIRGVPIHGGGTQVGVLEPGAQGRWPPNLALSDDAAALLDEMSGERKSGARSGFQGRGVSGVYADYQGFNGKDYEASTGGASRYFLRVAADDDDEPLRFLYEPKASAKDRNEGLEGMPERDTPDAHNLSSNACGRCGLRIKANGSGVKCECGDLRETIKLPAARNHHPTVKPTALCRWLVRLVTPPGGTVLDCFAGSGSTGKAAVLEGFGFVGIDNEAEYLAIAEKRIAHAQASMQLPLLEAV